MGMNKLTVFNFKSIDKMEIAPEGKSFTLKGKNGAGKSAVIEAIRWALEGGRVLSKDAIKQGEDYTEVIFEGDEFSITRKWKKGKNPSIKVTDKDGKIWASPQGMLDDLVSNLSFDPTAFLMQSDKAQVKSLQDLIDPDGMIAKMEVEKQTVYNNRTEAGREVNRLKGALDTLPQYPDAPCEEVKSDVLLKNLNDGQAIHRELDALVSNEISQSEKIKSIEAEITEAQSRLVKLQNHATRLHDAFDEIQKSIRETKKDLPDLEPLKQAFTDADETNKQVRANQAWAKARQELMKASAIHDELEMKHADCVKSIDKFIRNQKLPVKGLSFSPDCLMLDSKQFSDCSDGERLRISALISMAMNPTLKIIAIKNGSMLDDAGQKGMFDIAREYDYQLIMEIVGSGDLTTEIEQEFIGEEATNE